MHIVLKISVLFLTLGLFLMSTSSYACSIHKSEVRAAEGQEAKVIRPSFADKEYSCEGGQCKEQCCNSANHSHGESGCSGNCSGQSCSTGHAPFGCGITSAESITPSPLSLSKGKSFFHYRNSFYSFPFPLIWQPPKIG